MDYGERFRRKSSLHTCYYSLVIYFLDGTGLWSGVFFVSTSVLYSRNCKFSVNSLRSSVVFGGRLQRPSPCLVRAAPDRDQVWGLSETIENLPKCCILRSDARALDCILSSAELERINHGTTFPNSILLPKLASKFLHDDAFFMAAPRIACPIVATTAVCRCLSAQWV